MREDLPCDDEDDSLQKMCTITLVAGGNILVNTHDSRLNALSILQTVQPARLSSGWSSCWRVQGKEDGVRYVLRELRLDLPESVAMSHLGPLRELMLREARLLESIDHECVVRLECGWLEQRMDLAPRWPGDGVLNPNTGASAPHSCSISSTETRTSQSCGGGGVNAQSPPCSACYSWTSARPWKICEQDPVALLRACVPWVVGEEDSDSDRSDTEEAQGDLVVSRRTEGDIGQSHCRGDVPTRWIGVAEPKTSTMQTSYQEQRPLPNHAGQRSSLSCRERSGAVAQSVVTPREQGRDGCPPSSIVRLASYLLIPDGLPLGQWLETEFEPRTAPDEHGVSTAVATPNGWVQVWQQLVIMFLQVVRGVENLHVQGIVHNGISTDSVWVNADGRCRVGNMSQATPPGRHRPPPAAGPLHHFFSPERRRGGRVDSHSDVYSLGILLLEMWCRYLFARGLGRHSVTEMATSRGVELGQSACAGELLDSKLLARMLAEDPFDRPDCFELLGSYESRANVQL